MFEMADTFSDNTILVVTLRYGDHPKLWTYVLLKAGGLWYATGGGKAPQMAGWGAVKRWLSQSGRNVQHVIQMDHGVLLWRSDAEIGAAPNWVSDNAQVEK